MVILRFIIDFDEMFKVYDQFYPQDKYITFEEELRNIGKLLNNFLHIEEIESDADYVAKIETLYNGKFIIDINLKKLRYIRVSVIEGIKTYEQIKKASKEEIVNIVKDALAFAFLDYVVEVTVRNSKEKGIIRALNQLIHRCGFELILSRDLHQDTYVEDYKIVHIWYRQDPYTLQIWGLKDDEHG